MLNPYHEFLTKFDRAIADHMCIGAFEYIDKKDYGRFTQMHHHQLSRLLCICQNPQTVETIKKVMTAKERSEELDKFTAKFGRVVVAKLGPLVQLFNREMYNNPVYGEDMTNACIKYFSSLFFEYKPLIKFQINT